MDADEFRFVHLVQLLCLPCSGAQLAYIRLKLLRLPRFQCTFHCSDHADIEQPLLTIGFRTPVLSGCNRKNISAHHQTDR